MQHTYKTLHKISLNLIKLNCPNLLYLARCAKLEILLFFPYCKKHPLPQILTTFTVIHTHDVVYIALHGFF